MIHSAQPLAGEPASREPLLEIDDLRTYFHTRLGVGRAVDGISFNVARGEVVGLVGESGSGKSLTGLSIVGLHPQPAARIVGGSIRFAGREITGLPARELRKIRGRHIGLILQDPMTALNPVLSIRDQLGETLRLHTDLRGSALRARAIELLEELRIQNAPACLESYPHQLSGGMRQRVVSAIAIAAQPELIIADEPTTALDVTVQAAYLSMLRRLQREKHLSMLFISHDLSVVGQVCDRVVVMYAGKIMETARSRSLLQRPFHPYSQALLAATPRIDEPRKTLFSIRGRPPLATDLPSGCRFHTRCWLYERLDRPEQCRTELPVIQRVGCHDVACHFASPDIPTIDERETAGAVAR